VSGGSDGESDTPTPLDWPVLPPSDQIDAGAEVSHTDSMYVGHTDSTYVGKHIHEIADAVSLDPDDMDALTEADPGDSTLVVRSGSGRGMGVTMDSVSNSDERSYQREVGIRNFCGNPRAFGGTYLSLSKQDSSPYKQFLFRPEINMPCTPI
jgi:hypothetical protein